MFAKKQDVAPLQCSAAISHPWGGDCFVALGAERRCASGKHVFLEKPVAVDPAGIRTVIAAAQLAKEKGLSVVAGTQRRHQKHYPEVMQRIHDGAIGEIRAAQCYGNDAHRSLTEAKPAGMSDMEWQVRNWYFFCWICGDHIVEQHAADLSVFGWGRQAAAST
jgi:myo-inositol 2-dehydrogenase/D-chiro-inositol 1-dehydrogenase